MAMEIGDRIQIQLQEMNRHLSGIEKSLAEIAETLRKEPPREASGQIEVIG